jgi:ribosomal protein S4
MKQRSLQLVNKNLQDYYRRMRFYKKRLEKTLPFVLLKIKSLNLTSVSSAVELISKGNVRVNNRPVKTPNYICRARDTISLRTKQGVKRIKLNN